MARSETSEEKKERGEHFRSLVQTRRKQLKLTQSQLAEMANISVELVRALEGGRSCNPSFFVAIDIMRALDIELGKEVEQWASPKK